MLEKNKGYILRLRQSRTFKGLTLCLILNLVGEIAYPTVSLALTEGPSQPEVQSFEPISTNQMVDLFSGDFNYNIPLFNLPGPNGGYPVNIAYHAGATMDDEASWVGLGWNINVGSMVRSMRGLPDEFKSKLDEDNNADGAYDFLEVKSDIKQNWTFGGTGSLGLEALGADVIEGSLNASIYYNNYNGIGLSTGGNVGLGDSPFSLGLSLDSENGLGVSATVSMAHEIDDYTRNSHSLGLSFDGQLSVDYSISRQTRKATSLDECGDVNRYSNWESSGKGIGSGISFARSSFSPSIGHKINGYSLSISVKGGPDMTGFFAHGSVKVFYNTQDVNNKDKKGRKRPVVGYTASGALDLTNSRLYTQDFIRSNDGQITKSTMYLPNTSYSYDVYNSTGQGLSGYFRPHRSDIGRSFDPRILNLDFGLNLSIDLSPPVPGAKFGLDGGVSFGWSSQGDWDTNNDMEMYFENPLTIGEKENVYYQGHGESTILALNELDYMNGLNLPFMQLDPSNNDGCGPGKRKISQNSNYSSSRTPDKRVVRNTLIHTLTNKEVKNMGEFSIKYFNSPASVMSNSATIVLDRTLRDMAKPGQDARNVNIVDHPAGYKVLNQEGSYYVYGLPAYNNLEIENLFTVPMPSAPETLAQTSYSLSDGEVDYKINSTEKFINKSTKSPYAHSYLLSSVQGADYVDVKNDGPSDDDLGYWVKFSYLKYTDNYEWRAPYTSAQYHRGAIFTSDDDKASYQYGKKEVWYLGQMETKSHIAVFCMSARDDIKEASGEHANIPGVDNGLKIDAIKIYEKSSFKQNPSTAVPIQTIHFEYDYSLCKNAPNSFSQTKGKLTLKKLYFTSNGSTRGIKNKYEFNYGSTTYENPNYEENTYDSWGSYKPLSSNYEHHSRFPYTNQFNQDWSSDVWEPSYASNLQNSDAKNKTKNTQDQLVSAWCLKQIKLPSGGTINIDYESDDYGYVQHKTANQMFKIHKMGDGAGSELSPDEVFDNGPSNNDYYDPTSVADERRRRIYFKLEKPIPLASYTNAPQFVYDSYVKPIIQDESGNRNLFFKTKLRLTTEVYDYVSGYLPLEPNVMTGEQENYGVLTSTTATIDGTECYTHGFVTIQAAKKKNGNYFDNYHPMALAGWTYLQTNAQKLLSHPNSLEAEESYGNPRDVLNKIADLLNVIPTTASNFGAIRAYCKSKDMARFIDLNHSVIKLASPDKIKYGGGHRVKQISITDNWSSHAGSNEINHTYGQVYDYTIDEVYKDENGNNTSRKISSGVAQYEPQAGGDENPLKYPIYYFDKQNVLTKNNLFAEAPMNENMFPGASVGYRKVTVKSLNTDKQQKNAVANNSPKGRTGGITVHEFYTAKDFPTLVETSLLAEENDTKDVFNVPIPIPLIGSIKRNFYHGVQAYKIELNDMHGKPKSVKSYELNDYVMNSNPITSSIYEYQMEPLTYQNENVFKLNNFVKIIKNDGTHSENANSYLMGVEVDLFTDQREVKTFHQDMGIETNIDVALTVLGVGLPSVWGNFNNHKTMMRTYVTNKVIHRTGILKKTISRDLQSVNETEIIAYDEKSGMPLLSKIKNEFGDDFYSYNIPAHYMYDRMGHAYQNINYSFEPTISNTNHNHFSDVVQFIPTETDKKNLVRGDEVLIVPESNGTETAYNYQKGYFLGWNNNCVGHPIPSTGITYGLIHFPNKILTNNENSLKTTMKVVRSGRRNHHSSVAANYLSKGKLTGLTDYLLHTNLDGSEIKTKLIPSNVLTATASLFKDDWSANHTRLLNRKDPNSTSFFDEPLVESTSVLSQGMDITINPFISGNSGIWRPYKSYTYVGKRKNNASLSDNSSADNNKLYNDGVFEEPVPMFTWDIGNMEDYVSNWEWVNEITRFSDDSYENENINRLGIFSSALYGYDNSLSIGVGGNSSYFELGTDDFETAPTNGIWTNFERMLQNNLNFYSIQSNDNAVISENINIKNAVYDCNGNLNIKIKNPSDYVKNFISNAVYNGGDYLSTTFGLTLNSVKNYAQSGNNGYFFNGSCLSGTLDTDAFGNEILTVLIKPYIHCANENGLVMPGNSELYGKLTLFEKRPIVVNDYSQSVNLVNTKAHTGKKSMEISSTVAFDQPMLRLFKDKKYITSVWVSRANSNVVSYKTLNNNLIVPGIMSNGSFVPLSATEYKIQYSKVVEGWQKIDIEFSVNLDNAIIGFQFNPGSTSLYIDDFRFSPKVGGLVTSVYDPIKFWLRASLNVDNYATLFFYDEEGNLTLKKQETEKGIFSMMESRGHLYEQIFGSEGVPVPDNTTE